MTPDPGTALVPTDAPAVSLGVIHSTSPKGLVAAATEAADALAAVIAQKGLFNTIQGRKHVRVEGWTTLAAMLGCLPREAAIVRRDDGTYEATVELVRISDGTVLTRASAECGGTERTWKDRADYARRSMAATRATSKVCRLAFSWVMALAGYEATPAEELSGDEKETKADADGVVLELADEATKLTVFTEAKKAGLTKQEFPGWYFAVLGRPFANVYEQDVKPLLKAAAERIAAKGKKEPQAA